MVTYGLLIGTCLRRFVGIENWNQIQSAILCRSNGAQMISFCAHKLCSVKHIICDQRKQRVLTIAGAFAEHALSRRTLGHRVATMISADMTVGSAARVWTFKNGVRSMGTTELGARGTSAEVCGKHFVIGTANGAIHLVESETGLCAITLACAIHTNSVQSIHADQSHEWLVSTSADGTVKVWTISGAVIACLQNTRKVTCACFLNEGLDILLAAPTQLQVVRKEVYNPPSDVPCDPQSTCRLDTL